jgi:hypothetical protein
VQVRTTTDLDLCDALIIPGGGASNLYFCNHGCTDKWLSIIPESTTIALLARLSGLLDPLREFLTRKPVWGTCAGAILLAQRVEGAKKGGQELLGGMSITIQRNGWGSQVGPISSLHFIRPLMYGRRWNRSKHHLMWIACGIHINHLQAYSFVLQYVLLPPSPLRLFNDDLYAGPPDFKCLPK